ncbi:potassium channel family protein [uncultured Nocardioides sp.]|jgi:hypothetical protein|uniref:potassium channel family protein n=1 Tax=uncultured Nocardioides sp. TaxID=198441 RepID=UPI0023B4893E
MDVVTAVVGALLVLLALRDVFHTLFHPGDHGAFSARICAALWAVGSRAGRRGELLAGPLSVVLAMLLWIALLVAGFALLYLPLLPAGATYGHGVPSRGGVEGAAYLSSVALATLGLGDVVLTQPWARLLVPLQGLLGFGVLTAAIGWTSQIYPALARRRSLALDLSAALRATAPDRVAVDQLHRWTAALSAVTVDLVQNSETFYFRESDPRLGLGSLLRDLDLVTAAAREGVEDPSDRQVAQGALDELVDHLLVVLSAQFDLPTDRSGMLAALAPRGAAKD